MSVKHQTDDFIVSAQLAPAYQVTHIYETISGELEKLPVSFSRKLEKVG